MSLYVLYGDLWIFDAERQWAHTTGGLTRTWQAARTWPYYTRNKGLWPAKLGAPSTDQELNYLFPCSLPTSHFSSLNSPKSTDYDNRSPKLRMHDFTLLSKGMAQISEPHNMFSTRCPMSKVSAGRRLPPQEIKRTPKFVFVFLHHIFTPKFPITWGISQ